MSLKSYSVFKTRKADRRLILRLWAPVLAGTVLLHHLPAGTAQLVVQLRERLLRREHQPRASGHG